MTDPRIKDMSMRPNYVRPILFGKLSWTSREVSKKGQSHERTYNRCVYIYICIHWMQLECARGCLIIVQGNESANGLRMWSPKNTMGNARFL